MDATTAARHGYNPDAEEDATEEEFALADSHGPVLGELEQAFAEMQSQFAGDEQVEPITHVDRMAEFSQSRRLSEDSLDGCENNSSSSSSSSNNNLVNEEGQNAHSDALPHSASHTSITSPKEPTTAAATVGEDALAHVAPTASPVASVALEGNETSEAINQPPSIHAESPLPNSSPLSAYTAALPAAAMDAGSPTPEITAASPAAEGAATKSPLTKIEAKKASPSSTVRSSPSGGGSRRSPYAAHVNYSGRRGRASPASPPLESSGSGNGVELDMDSLARAKAVVAAAAEVGDALSGVNPSIAKAVQPTTTTEAAAAAKPRLSPTKAKAVSPVRSPATHRSPAATSAGKKSAKASPSQTPSGNGKPGVEKNDDDDSGMDNDLMARARAMCAAANSLGGSNADTNDNGATMAAADFASTTPISEEPAAGATTGPSHETDPNWVRLPGTVAAIAGSSLLTTSADWRPSLLSARGGPLRIWVNNAAASGSSETDTVTAAAETNPDNSDTSETSFVVVQLAAASSKGEWSERAVALSCDWPGPTCLAGVAERPANGAGVSKKKKNKSQNLGWSQKDFGGTPAGKGVAEAANQAEAAVAGVKAALSNTGAGSSSTGDGNDGSIEGRNLAQRRALSRLRQQRGGGVADERKRSTANDVLASTSDANGGESMVDTVGGTPQEEETGRSRAGHGSNSDGAGHGSNSDGDEMGEKEANDDHAGLGGGTNDGGGQSARAHPEPGAVRRRLSQGRKGDGEEASRSSGGHSSSSRSNNGKRALNNNNSNNNNRPSRGALAQENEEEAETPSGGDANITIAAAREAALKRARERQHAEKAAQEAAALTAHAEELLKKAATAQQVERLREATARRLAEKAKKKRAEAAAEAARAAREAEEKALAAAAEDASANEREALLRAARRETAARRARQALAASAAASSEEARRLEALAEHREEVAKAQGNLAAGFGHASAGSSRPSPPHKAATAAVATSAATAAIASGTEQRASPRELYLKQQQLSGVDEANDPPHNLQGTVAVQHEEFREVFNENGIAAVADTHADHSRVSAGSNGNGSAEGSSRSNKGSKSSKSAKKTSNAWRTRAPVPVSKAYVSVAAAEEDILTREGSRRPITPPSEASAAAIARRREARAKQQPLFGAATTAAAHGGFGFGSSSTTLECASAFDPVSVHGALPPSSVFGDVLPEPDPTPPLASPPKPPPSNHPMNHQQQHQAYTSVRTTPPINNRRGSASGNKSGKASSTREGYAHKKATEALTGGAAIRARARADMVLEAEAAKAAQFEGKLLENSALMQGYK